MREPFPLQWPDGWPRTPSDRRERSRFADVSNYQAALELHRELRLYLAGDIVITSNLPTRSDGLPLAGTSAKDPGVAVYWTRRRVEYVMACDRWRSASENMRAIAKTIEALRGIDRWGSSAIQQRAFTGFATALPPGQPAPPAAAPLRKRSWREVLGLDADWARAAPRVAQLALAKDAYRRLMKTAHPDVGGDHATAAELNTALAEAELELQGAAA